MRYLLHHGVDPNVRAQGPQAAQFMPVLHFAMFHGNVDAAMMLIAAKADVDAMDRAGHTPLHIAVKLQQEELVAALLKHNANTNVLNHLDHMTPLHLVRREWCVCVCVCCRVCWLWLTLCVFSACRRSCMATTRLPCG
jgi:ankyrin repeat protein